VETLAPLGRVIPLGSVVSGLMVWRDVDFGVDSPGLSVDAAWRALLPLITARECTSLDYSNERDYLYFVLRLDGWKLDVTLWTEAVPDGVETWQDDLVGRLDAETRLTILRLKDAWQGLPPYPYTVGGYEICVAVLDHGIRTLDELDSYFAERGLPMRQ
jgi:hypothetical protein